MSDKVVITCALNGVLTDPKQHNVSVTPEQMARRHAQQQLANLVLSALPVEDGVTLAELQGLLQGWQLDPHLLRPSVLLKALQHLQHAGLAATTANQPGDALSYRRYWRAPTSGN